MALLLSALERALTQSNKPATLKRISRGLTRLVLAVDTKVRAVEARSAVLPEILSTAGETLRSHIRAPHPPWEAEDLGTCDVPGMVSPEECRYYL
jgi:hypothetical protein